MRHILSVLVDNKPGVLTRVAGMFSRRGYNIDSIAVGTERDPAFSRMTIVVHGDDFILEQINKQLNKLIDVIKVNDLTATTHVEREMQLMRIKCTVSTRSEIMQICDIFRGRIIDVSADSMMIEVTGTADKNQAFLDLLSKFGVQELARTGKIALSRGSAK
ncbi:MAG: acetolactate synthase small subunit [Candidatus Margulisiibacteriota bacterium]|jgi:acetolactate synthase-1/3 small subunit